MSFVFDGLDIQNITSGLGTSSRRSVKVASTANINLSSDLSSSLIDGVVVNVNDRILLKNQASGAQNGIYIVGSGIGNTLRSEDYIEGSNAASTMMYVQQGTVNADTGWLCTNDSGSDVIGTNTLNYQQFSGNGVDGDINGPGSSTDNAIVRWDGATGTTVQNSNIVADDVGNMSGVRYVEINDITAPANPSNGQGRLYKKTGNDGIFWKPDSGGSEVDLTQTVTASNEGTAGVGVFVQKTVNNLEFKNINAGSNKITVTNDAGNNEIDINVNESNIVHDNLSGFVANEHVDHSAVNINTTEGIQGGGNITTTRNLTLDINGLAADASPNSANDYVATYDASAASHKKVLLQDILSLLGGSVDRVSVGAAGNSNPDASTTITFITTTSAGSTATGTLGNGTSDGQIKYIIASSLLANYTMTVTNGIESNGTSMSTIVFDSTGQSIQLVWDATQSDWFIANAGANVS